MKLCILIAICLYGCNIADMTCAADGVSRGIYWEASCSFTNERMDSIIDNTVSAFELATGEEVTNDVLAKLSGIYLQGGTFSECVCWTDKYAAGRCHNSYAPGTGEIEILGDRCVAVHISHQMIHHLAYHVLGNSDVDHVNPLLYSGPLSALALADRAGCL